MKEKHRKMIEKVENYQAVEKNCRTYNVRT